MLPPLSVHPILLRPLPESRSILLQVVSHIFIPHPLRQPPADLACSEDPVESPETGRIGHGEQIPPGIQFFNHLHEQELDAHEAEPCGVRDVELRAMQGRVLPSSVEGPERQGAKTNPVDP